MNITMLGIPNCDTVKKSRKFLENHHIAFQFRDLRKQPLSAAEWTDLVDQDQSGTLLNLRSPTFRKTGVAKEELNRARLVLLLCEHPTAAKRPVLLRQGRLYSVGYDETAFAALTHG